MPENYNNQTFEKLAQHLIKQHWDFYPTAGSRIGRHEYDGRLPDLSPGPLRRRAEELQHGLAQLSGMDPSGLDQEGRLSYQLLELFLKRELFTLTELRPLDRKSTRLNSSHIQKSRMPSSA